MATGYSVGNLEMSIQTVGNGAVTSLTLTNAQLKQMLRLLGGNNIQLGKMGGNFNKTFNFAKTLGKIYFIRNYSKQLMQNMSSLVQSAIDYTETLNLWQVAMRGNIDTAEEFISKMNKAYGIAEQTLMKYQATFRNMLSTLGGVSTDVSYALSEYLTQMALDYASLYNTSIEKAMTVFQSVLSGQVRPIRSISGYDITETTIFELYQQLGGTKTMRQLSQTEKRLLRIYAVFQQMDRSGAIGDLNKTLNNTANQMRIMSESAKELGVWIGKMIELYVAPALPYLNAFLITAKNIAQAITKSLPNYSEFDGTIKGYEETAEAMDEVQGKLLDFDKFRSLSGGEEENNLGLGIDEKLIAGLTQYQSILENVSNKATELAEKWTAWFINDETGEFTNKAKGLLAVLTAISALSIFKGITGSKKDNAFFLAFASKETGDSIAKIAQSIGGVSKATQLLGGAIKFLMSPVGIIVAILGVLYFQNEEFRESINNLIGSLSPLFTILFDLVGQILKPLVPMLSAIIDLLGTGLSYVVRGITWVSNLGLALLSGILYPLEAIWKVAVSVVELLRTLFTWDWSNLGNNLSNIWSNWGTNNYAKSSFGSLKKFSNGGLVEDGLFTMNKGEVMGTFDDGTSIVANNQQIISGIKQGVYQAVSQAMANSGTSDDRPIDIYIDGEKVFQATKKNAKRHGLAFSKV